MFLLYVLALIASAIAIRNDEAEGGDVSVAIMATMDGQLEGNPGSSENGKKSVVHRFGQGWSRNGIVITGGYVSIVALTFLISAALRVYRSKTEVSTRARLSITGLQTLDGCTQTGHRRTAVGSIIYALWIFISIMGQILNLAWLLALHRYWDPLQLQDGHLCDKHCWEVKVEPFIVTSLVSVAILFYTASQGDKLTMSFMCSCELGQADFVIIKGPNHQHVAVVRRESPPSFDFMCFRYVYVPAELRFRPVGELTITGDTVQKILASNGLRTEAVQKMQFTVGFNEVPFEVPRISASLFAEFHTRMYAYQMIVIWYAFAFSKWFLGVTWLVLIIVTATGKSLLTRRNLIKVRDMALVNEAARVFRDGRLVSVPARELVPGDLVVVESGSKMTCDCVLVRGGAVMLEAMLTGEPMPISKEAWAPEMPEVKATNILHAGTKVLDANGYREGTVEGALGVVKAIGGATQTAHLIRSVLCPTAMQFEYEDDLMIMYRFLVIYALCLFCIMKWSPYKFNRGDNRTAVTLRAVFAIFQVISPMLSVAIAFGKSKSAEMLREKGISCLDPEKVPIAGCIDVFVLDKTGTITKDGMELQSILPCKGVSMGELCPVGEFELLDQEVQYALLSCQKLSVVNEQIVGNSIDVEIFNAFPNWSLELSGDSRVITDGTLRLEVLRVLEFDHSRMTSGCICKLPDGSIQVFVKGAVAKVSGYCKEAPVDFVDLADRLSAQCFYVIGLASKPLGKLSVARSSRDELESDLHSRGLLLFKNDLKPDSAAAIAELTAGSTKCVICTGDHFLSGVSVAKQVGIILPHQRVYRITVEVDDETISFIELETKKSVACGDVVDELSSGGASLTLTQEDWDNFLKLRDITDLLPYISVFARMRPDGKVAVVERLQRLGFYVGMCGDGGNDCGALHAAHAGLALSTSDASIAAEFSSGTNDSLYNVVELLKEGRACLATNVACFCWFLAYGFAVTTMKLFLLLYNGANAAGFQWIYIDCFLAVGIPWAMTCSTAHDTLSPFRPSCRLFTSRVGITVFGQFFFFAATMACVFIALAQQEFYEVWRPVRLGISASKTDAFADNFESECAFLVLAFHLQCCGIVLSYGSHHRKALLRNIVLWLGHLFGVVFLLTLLFTKGTAINCLMRISCDGKTYITDTIPILSRYEKIGASRCFLGPQMIHWGDNLPEADSAEEKLAHMIQYANSNRRNATSDRTCNAPAHMKAPVNFAGAEKIHNIMPHEFCVLLLGIILFHSVCMHLWYYYVSLSRALDISEKNASLQTFFSGSGEGVPFLAKAMEKLNARVDSTPWWRAPLLKRSESWKMPTAWWKAPLFTVHPDTPRKHEDTRCILVWLMRANHLVDEDTLDGLGRSDPFARIGMLSHGAKLPKFWVVSSSKPEEDNPTWCNGEGEGPYVFWLSDLDVEKGVDIIVEILDDDGGTQDDSLGTAIFKMDRTAYFASQPANVNPLSSSRAVDWEERLVNARSNRSHGKTSTVTMRFAKVDSSVLKGCMVCADVDDTVKPGRHWPAGVDRLYKKGANYPGVAAFMLELARGIHNVPKPPRMVLLSARPQELNVSIARDDPMALKLDGIAGLEKASPDCMDLQWGVAWDYNQYGTVADGFDWLAYGERKFESARDRIQHWGYPFVFVGDDGQGDLTAATKMYTELAPVDGKNGRCVDAWQNGWERCAGFSGAFIHRVFDWDDNKDRIPKRLEWVNSLGGAHCVNLGGDYSKKELEALAERGIFPFRTYDEAARIAYEYGFISLEGFHRAITETVIDHMELSDGRYWHAEAACRAPKSNSTSEYYEQVFRLNPGDYDTLVKVAAGASKKIPSPAQVRSVLRGIVAAVHEQLQDNLVSTAGKIQNLNAAWNGSIFDKPGPEASLVPLVLKEFGKRASTLGMPRLNEGVEAS